MAERIVFHEPLPDVCVCVYFMRGVCVCVCSGFINSVISCLHGVLFETLPHDLILTEVEIKTHVKLRETGFIFSPAQTGSLSLSVCVVTASGDLVSLRWGKKKKKRCHLLLFGESV